MQRHFLAGLLLTVACSSIHAQTMNLRATVPFAFRAGGTIMPAGEYTIHDSNGVLIIKQAAGNHAAILLTIGASRPNLPTDGQLQFQRYGEDYFLATIWSPDSRDGLAVVRRRPEKEIAARTVAREPVSVALRRP